MNDVLPHWHAKTRRFYEKRAAKTAINHAEAESKSRTALVLGGGAPNSALMAGALAAFAEAGVSFDVVSTSGAGGLIGLLWLAPKDGDPVAALNGWLDSYVDDTIYDVFPVDYKVFFKPGAAADAYRGLLDANPWVQAVRAAPLLPGPWQRLWRDWFDLVTATLSPSDLSPASPGLCARVPWAEKLVDFDRVKHIDPFFYLNAYNITTEQIDNFRKDQITLDHFRAAFAFPFIYGPYQIGENLYYEGASQDCLNFKDLTERHPGLETIVVFDVLGSRELIRAPRDLYDSWVLSMIIPLVAVAEDDLKGFAAKYNHGWSRAHGAKTDLKVLRFDLGDNDEELETVLDWSYSNGRRLFEVGRRSARAFLLQNPDLLPPAPPKRTAKAAKP